MAWSRRLLSWMTLCVQSMWVWILPSAFTENRYRRDVELLGIVLEHPTHPLLLTACPCALSWPTRTHDSQGDGISRYGRNLSP